MPIVVLVGFSWGLGTPQVLPLDLVSPAMTPVIGFRWCHSTEWPRAWRCLHWDEGLAFQPRLWEDHQGATCGKESLGTAGQREDMKIYLGRGQMDSNGSRIKMHPNQLGNFNPYPLDGLRSINSDGPVQIGQRPASNPWRSWGLTTWTSMWFIGLDRRPAGRWRKVG